MPVEHISDTARWVAVYRAMETERSDALFRDPWARKLAGAVGEDIVRRIPRGRAVAWSMIVRTAVFDEIILRLVNREGADLVLNLAAGLDTRPWRLDLPPTLRWVDVDLPAILAQKRETLAADAPRCAYEAVGLDLTDLPARRALLARLAGECERALVVSEGLLIYLAEEQVGALADDLHGHSAFRWWLFDLANPWLLRYMQRSWGRALEGASAPMRFAPASGTDFFAPHGWRELEYRSSVEEARRLRREMRLAGVWRLLGRFASRRRREEWRRAGGTVLMGRIGNRE
ncbi:MAG TPA: SAM-dependent methyltransferase [Gemmatimonadaceae bacterium]